MSAIGSPEGSRRQGTKKAPRKHHTPRSACGLSYKGTSLGLRLDLTASRAGPAWGKGGSTFTGRGIAPLPTRRPLRNAPSEAREPFAKRNPQLWPDRRSPPKAVARGLRASGCAEPVSPERSELRSRRYAECDSFTFNLQTLAGYCGRPGPWWFRFHLVARRALSVSSSTPIYPFYIGRPAAPPRHETQLVPASRLR